MTLNPVCLGPVPVSLPGRTTHSHPFISVLAETIGFVVTLDSMKLGIKIVIFPGG